LLPQFVKRQANQIPQKLRAEAVELNPSRLNLRLAELVGNSVSADVSRISGQAGFWRAIATGLLCFGFGSAVGIGFFGYSFVTRNSENMDFLSDAIAKAMSKVQLQSVATGTVQIQPREIRLASGQTVSFDPESRLHLDPNAKVNADGEIKIQAPTISIPQNPSPRSVSRPAITNFTIFKTVPFEKGSVLTGWNFLTSAQKLPSRQYCYYTEQGESSDVSVRLDIAVDGSLGDSKTFPKSFDVSSAFSKCVWFDKDRQ
jgi:hypothetical protein